MNGPVRLAQAAALLALTLAAAAGCDRRDDLRRDPGSGAPAASARSVSSAAPAPASTPSARTAAATPRSAAAPASAATPPEPLLPRAPRGQIWQHAPKPSAVNAGLPGPVDPARDADALSRLAAEPIASIVENRGGSSVTFKARFADGARAAVKPEQEKWRVGHRAEIAAYHLDRVLGLGRVAPVAGRRFERAALRAHLVAAGAKDDWLARFDRDVIDRNAVIDAAVIAWHPKTLGRAEPPRGWTDGLSSDEGPRADVASRLGEWSDMVVFDFLIDNTDRWSGGNVLTLGPGGPLIYLDNAAGFSPWRNGATTRERLDPLCRFRKPTIDALRALTARGLGATLAKSLKHDALSPVLNDGQLAELDVRARLLLEHADRCVARLSERVVYDLNARADGGAPPVQVVY